MLEEIKKFLNTKAGYKIKLAAAIIFFVKVLMYIAAVVSIPIFLYFIKYISLLSQNDNFYKSLTALILKFFSEDGYNLKTDIAVNLMFIWWMVIALIVMICVYIIYVLVTFYVFRKVKAYFTPKMFYLECSQGWKGELKFIAVWVALYALLSLFTRGVLGLSDHTCNLLNIFLYQPLIFYFLLSKEVFGNKIKEKNQKTKKSKNIPDNKIEGESKKDINDQQEKKTDSVRKSKKISSKQ